MTKTVYISRRPTNIIIDIVYFPISDISEKDIDGPVLPNPGPLLPRADIQLNMLSCNELPLIRNKSTPIKNNKKKIIKKYLMVK